MRDVVPYRNYLRALIYSGLSVPQIIVYLNNSNLNALLDEDLKKEINKCVSFPDGKDMREANMKAIKNNTPWTAHQSVIDTFYPHEDEFIGFVDFYVNTRVPDGFFDQVDKRGRKRIGVGRRRKVPKSLVQKIMQIPEISEAKRWFECGLMTSVPLHKIRLLWNNNRSYQERYGYATLTKYFYYYWDVSKSRQREKGFTKADIASYLLLDSTNESYAAHRFMIDKSSSQTVYFLGYMSKEEIDYINKQILGMLTIEMVGAFKKSGKSLPQWIYQLWSDINNMLREDELRGKGPQEDIDEMMRIIQRIDDVHSKRRTLDDIRNEEIDGRKHIKDTAIDVTKR